ncbi:YbaB/EbfC family nucleoid-associated protein [Actinokineospora cianjurensis]|uniref:YbaB/EbfC DNA-binding family protein n=1 Tax=Actinokineospora cianjurensis TaxID=585224 RepID=A0A421B3M2_9PSEU|nr:YbaB/EbfC family nucleoid-associated protein [Actinokineospora cianjurensis]RLK58967.1 YbaB/EbfC DNA-binding family protein [Actinokineospora cianjurensis]
MDQARYDETQRRFAEQAANAARLKDSIAQLKGSARSTDGSVTVTVAPSGAVLGLQLAPAAMNRSHTQLTQDILATIRAAQQEAAARMADTVRPLVGDAQYDRFQAAFRAQSPAVEPLGPTAPPPLSALPAPPSTMPVAPTRRPRTQAPPDDDGDFTDESIYRDRS